MKVGSLFAGIGGFDLAARWMGWETSWYSEIDPYASAVMQKQFPNAINLGDVTSIDGKQAVPVDILCGGFPCQDISLAGKGEGIGGARSGLWSHYARLIDEIRPRYAVIENVSALRSRGLEQVLGSLAALGYNAEWHCIPAAYVGAPHRRDRIWIVAWPRLVGADADQSRLEGWLGRELQERTSQFVAGTVGASADPDPDSERQQEWSERDGVAFRPELEAPRRDDAGGLRNDVAYANRNPGEGQCGPPAHSEERGPSTAECQDVRRKGEPCPDHARSGGETLADPTASGLPLGGRASLADSRDAQQEPERCSGSDERIQDDAGSPTDAGWWESEPDVGRVAARVPARVDRLRCLGNAVVPQIPYLIFQAIEAEERRAAGGA